MPGFTVFGSHAKRISQTANRPRLTLALECLEDRLLMTFGGTVGPVFPPPSTATTIVHHLAGGPRGDFDGDHVTDMTVWRPTDGTWYSLTSRSGFTDRIQRQWGQPGDVAMQNSDFDGDGVADMAVWRPSDGTWYVLTSNVTLNGTAQFSYANPLIRQWGAPGDIPIQNSDFDGDGRADMAVWRPSNGTWYVLTSGSGWNYNATITRQWGVAGDIPLQGSDFDGDGRADMAVWRPSDGTWYVLPSSSGYSYNSLFYRQFGVPGAIPLLGTDIDGDQATDMVVWTPNDSTFHVLRSGTYFNAIQQMTIPMNSAGGVPLQGSDFDGDGMADLAVYQPLTGSYTIAYSSGNFVPYVQIQGSSTTNSTAGTTPVPLQNADFDGDGKADLASWQPGYHLWNVYKSSAHFSWNDVIQRSWGNLGDIPMPSAPNTDARRLLYVDFDGASLSWDDLTRYAHSTKSADGTWTKGEWNFGPSNLLGAGNSSITVGSFLANRSDREAVIAQVISQLQNDLGAFGITVVRLRAGNKVVENEFTTTIFIGPNNSSSSSAAISSDIDDGNNNHTDISFVDEDRVFTDSGNLFVWSARTNNSVDTHANTVSLPASATFSVAWTGLDVADQALHEVGHTYGLVHVNDSLGPVNNPWAGPVNDAMGYRYTTGWWVDVSFVNEPLYYFIDNSDLAKTYTDRSRWQNSFQSMLTWTGTGSSFGTGSGAAPAALTNENALLITKPGQTKFDALAALLVKDRVSQPRLRHQAVDALFAFEKSQAAETLPTTVAGVFPADGLHRSATVTRHSHARHVKTAQLPGDQAFEPVRRDLH